VGSLCRRGSDALRVTAHAAQLCSRQSAPSRPCQIPTPASGGADSDKRNAHVRLRRERGALLTAAQLVGLRATQGGAFRAVLTTAAHDRAPARGRPLRSPRRRRHAEPLVDSGYLMQATSPRCVGALGRAEREGAAWREVAGLPAVT
jgi:hypothetical protein